MNLEFINGLVFKFRVKDTLVKHITVGIFASDIKGIADIYVDDEKSGSLQLKPYDYSFAFDISINQRSITTREIDITIDNYKEEITKEISIALKTLLYEEVHFG